MDFAHDHKQFLSAHQIGIPRQFGQAGWILPAAEEDIHERKDGGEGNVRCRKEHQDVGELEGLENHRLLQEDELQNSVFFGKRNPQEGCESND